jgi:hypothetical protein
MMKTRLYFSFALTTLWLTQGFCDNQTATTSPIYPGSELPFEIQIEQADFSLPLGVHSGASAIYQNKWLLIAGRTNGLHGFGPGNNNFPPNQQNTTVFVIDPIKKKVYTRSLLDPSSGLTQSQIDLLSVTSPQSAQKDEMLYITGGYGVDTSTGLFSTKPSLTAINIPGLIHWVTHPLSNKTAVENIRQIFDPICQVTGGYMALNGDVALLMLGQNFTGFYQDSSNGAYTQQIRRFKIKDDGKSLSIFAKNPSPLNPDPNYRRRDLNIMPIVQKSCKGHPYSKESHRLQYDYVALSGVFTETTGIWTVPIRISNKGVPSMADPSLSSTFKQGMNNYVSATIGLFSKCTGDMYSILLGGISYGYFQNGQFLTDDEFPFINQVSTVLLNSQGEFSQYLMSAQYPLIPSTASNPGNPLLFGAGADFFPAPHTKTYPNGVFPMELIQKEPIVLGYIVGGIQSTLPNTNVISDSAASPYIFRVTIKRK